MCRRRGSAMALNGSDVVEARGMGYLIYSVYGNMSTLVARRPLEVYDWWPIRAEGRLLQRLSTMPVRVRYKEAAPADAWRSDWPAVAWAAEWRPVSVSEAAFPLMARMATGAWLADLWHTRMRIVTSQ